MFGLQQFVSVKRNTNPAKKVQNLSHAALSLYFVIVKIVIFSFFIYLKELAVEVHQGGSGNGSGGSGGSAK